MVELSKKQQRWLLTGVTLVVGWIIVSNLFDIGASTAPAKRTVTAAVVSNSEWDGSVRQIKDYMQANAKDPASLEYMEWSDVEKRSDGTFRAAVKYRAKNSFGGYVIEQKVFIMDQAGNIISVQDFTGNWK